MTIQLHYMRSLLEKQIRDNCGSVTLTVEDMIECLDREAGLNWHSCESVIERKIRQAADEALARTLGQ